MALEAYNSEGGVKAGEFEVAWNSAIDTASNGSETLGFTHLSDKGLARNLYIPYHSDHNTKKVRNGEAHVDEPLKYLHNVTITNEYKSPTRLDFCDMAEDYLALKAHFISKGSDEELASKMAGFAAVNRNHLVRHGLCNEEVRDPNYSLDTHKGYKEYLSISPKGNRTVDYVKASDAIGVTDKIRGELVAYAKVPASILSMAFEFSGVNNFSSNHSTTGTVLPAGQIKVYAALLGIDVFTIDKGIGSKLTDMAYTIFHPCSKTLYFSWTFGKQYAGIIICATTVHKHWQALDSFMELRRPKLPAGTAALGLVQRTMRPLAESGLILIVPSASAVTSLKTDLGLVVQHPFSYHPGCRYLEVGPRSLSVDQYRDFLADSGYYIKQMNVLRTVLKSPVMQAAMATGANTAWVKFVDSVAASTDLSDPKAVMEKVRAAGGADFAKVDLSNTAQAAQALAEALDVATLDLDVTAGKVNRKKSKEPEVQNASPTAAGFSIGFSTPDARGAVTPQGALTSS